MCLLITLALLVFGGFFGYTAVVAPVVSEPQIIEVQPTVEIVTTAMAQVPTQAFSCAARATTEDINDMLALVRDTFKGGDWQQQIRTEINKTTAIWRSDQYGAVAFLEYLHYDCGVTQEQIDDYYSPEGFALLLSNYGSYAQTAHCKAEGIELFEFHAGFNGSDYHIQYWVEQVSPTRVAGLMLVFPASMPAQQAETAGRLAPALPTCEEAAG